MKFLVGTISQMGSRGLAMVEVKDCKIHLLWEDHSLINPTWITCVAPGIAYVVSSNYEGEFTGCINQIAYNEKGMQILKRLPTNGNSPCHIALTENGSFLVTANYRSGSVTIMSLNKGSLSETIQTVVHEGKGVHPQRQEQPHVHQISTIPTLPHCFCAADLGTDALVVYEQDTVSGQVKERYRIHLPAGEGPRHVAFSEDGAGYVVTELGNKVFPVHFLETEGFVDTGVSTLLNPDVENTAAAITVRDGSIYVSNRGEDTIAVFNPKPLEKNRSIRTVGRGPRDFCLLPEKDRILAACQGDGLYLLDGDTVIDFLPLVGAVRVVCVEN